MKNLLSTTARMSRNGGGEKVLDDLRLFGGEEMQWRIFLSLLIVRVTPLFSELLYVGIYTQNIAA
jgi:hypothetical protein